MSEFKYLGAITFIQHVHLDPENIQNTLIRHKIYFNPTTGQSMSVAEPLVTELTHLHPTARELLEAVYPDDNPDDDFGAAFGAAFGNNLAAAFNSPNGAGLYDDVQTG